MRNLKVLGLAFVAALALSAISASAASAGTALVTGGPNVTGEDVVETNTELTGVAGVKCKVATYSGTASESTITLTPSFSECATSGGAPVTVTVNGCAYKLTMGNLSGMSAPVSSTQLVCGTGKSIEVHIYGDAKHEVPACTLNIGTQTPASNIHVEDKTDGTLTITGTASNISSTLSGACVTGHPFTQPTHAAIPNPVASILHVHIKLKSGLGLKTQEEG